ncbi:MAG: FAD binding domain-containing protein [Variibacter sp.]|nr:FAD binding domain-containing protein [Variibacter sp.]
MKPAPFIYHAPKTLDECVALLAEFGEDAALLAGGQSLLALLRFRLAQPAHVISIRGIGGPLAAIRDTGEGLAIGALMTHAKVQRSPEIAAACPGIPKAIELVATPAVRARGTVCGNLSHADPASELPAIALIMEARFHLHSMQGARVVPAQDFFLGPYTTARRSDEILTAVEFPKRPRAERISVLEVSRLRGGFPMSGVAVALTRGEGRTLASVAVGCFGVHASQLRVREAEAALEAHGYTAEGIAAAADAVDRAIEPHSDPFASAAYRRSATRTLLRRAIDEACQGGMNG